MGFRSSLERYPPWNWHSLSGPLEVLDVVPFGYLLESSFSKAAGVGWGKNSGRGKKSIKETKIILATYDLTQLDKEWGNELNKTWIFL